MRILPLGMQFFCVDFVFNLKILYRHSYKVPEVYTYVKKTKLGEKFQLQSVSFYLYLKLTLGGAVLSVLPFLKILT